MSKLFLYYARSPNLDAWTSAQGGARGHVVKFGYCEDPKDRQIAMREGYAHDSTRRGAPLAMQRDWTLVERVGGCGSAERALNERLKLRCPFIHVETVRGWMRAAVAEQLWHHTNGVGELCFLTKQDIRHPHELMTKLQVVDEMAQTLVRLACDDLLRSSN